MLEGAPKKIFKAENDKALIAKDSEVFYSETLPEIQSEETEKNNIESMEESFGLKVEKLPKELYQKWNDEYESLEEVEKYDFFNRFHVFYRKRTSALTSQSDVNPEAPEEIKEKIYLVTKSINESYFSLNDRLGEGRTAVVVIHPDTEEICVKYIKDVSLYGTDIHLNLEYERLKDLQFFTVDGIRTPLPYFVDINTNLHHLYGMERVMGNSLAQIVEQPEENIDLIKLALSLDREDVLKRLVNYIKTMHQEFKITHNDLARRNIMLDNSGNFFVIDLGKSKYEDFGEDHEIYRDYDIKTLKTEVNEFFAILDTIDISTYNTSS